MEMVKDMKKSESIWQFQRKVKVNLFQNFIEMAMPNMNSNFLGGFSFVNSFKYIEAGEWCSRCNERSKAEEICWVTFEQILVGGSLRT